MPARMCGTTRTAGDIYATTPLSPYGTPLEEFIVDPPQIIDPAALGLSAVGVKLIEFEGTHHVFDIVGESHYPNVADFYEETARLGASRKLARTLDFNLLSERSRLILIHRRAHITNAQDYFNERNDSDDGEIIGTPRWGCVKKLREHLDPMKPPPMCASLWWEDLDGGEPVNPHDEENRGRQRLVKRDTVSATYPGWSRPPDVTPEYEYAIFLSLPIARLEVIYDPESNRHYDSATKARASKLPVTLEDE